MLPSPFSPAGSVVAALDVHWTSIHYRSLFSQAKKAEAELVSCYRQLNRAGRDMLLSTARAFAGNPDMTEEKESAQAM